LRRRLPKKGNMIDIKVGITIIFFVVLVVSPSTFSYAEGTSAPLTPSLTESFHADLMTGSAVASVPIAVPPGRRGLQPGIALGYSSSSPNNICGVGWQLDMGSIQRNTKSGVPKYDSTDSFLVNMGGANAELVDIGSGEYRAKQEGAFFKFSFDGTSWQVKDKSGTTYLFGSSANSRQTGPSGDFKWCLDRVVDLHGNYMSLSYIEDRSQLYPDEILYTGKEGADAPTNEVQFIYEARNDPFSGYRSGFEVTTAKRLSEVDVAANGQRARKYGFGYTYSPETGRSLLTSVTQYGTDGVTALPPITFDYQAGSTIGQ